MQESTNKAMDTILSRVNSLAGAVNALDENLAILISAIDPIMLRPLHPNPPINGNDALEEQEKGSAVSASIVQVTQHVKRLAITIDEMRELVDL